jgi:hypothetical protein
MASFAGACQEELKALKQARSDKDLLKLYWDNIKFCMVTKFPDPQYILKNFAHMAVRSGIYADTTLESDNVSKAVFLGSTTANLNCHGAGRYRYYVNNSCEIFIAAKESCFVVIDIFDHASLHLDVQGDAQVYVFKIGTKQPVNIKGSAIVVERSLKCYLYGHDKISD